MPVRRDQKTKRWFFRTTVKMPNGYKKRVSGTPGKSGAFHDLPNTKVGAQEAERRAIVELLKPGASVATVPEETKERPEEVPTVREYSKVFMESYLPEQKPSERRTKHQILKSHILPVFGEMRIDTIIQEDVGRFVASELKRKIKAKTVSNRLAVLSTLLKYAWKNGKISKPNLSFKVKGLSAEVVAVAAEDVDRLLVACEDQRYRVAILLAADAGLRAGEIRGLQWGDIKDGLLTVRRALDKGTSEVIAPKHDKARIVPISERLAESLETLPKRGLWVVCRLDGELLRYDGFLEVVRDLYKKAKVEKPSKPIHCLRHTFGTESAARGMPLPVLKKLMGHSMIETTMRYVHVNEQQMRDEIARVFNRPTERMAGIGSNAVSGNKKPC